MTLKEFWTRSKEARQRFINAAISETPTDYYDGFSLLAKDNQHMIEAYFKKAQDERLEGVKTVGSKYIVEELRREGMRETSEKRQFNINNNYTGSLARLAMRMFPKEFGEFFRIRQGWSK
jgi:hypothetical protein